MNHMNPEIEASLKSLAEICCETLSGDDGEAMGRADALLKSLLMNGYTAHEKRSLQNDLESRVQERCRDAVLHRGGELTAISLKLSQKLAELTRWESRSPNDDSPPKAANISAETEA